ncbi:hypothetical protein EDD18DRAFT_521417 [Armillaria luteobubalina]|uniref:Uncharacterized protein n=1 Tax=Armillaria luteobubalina TaxID=153913 RepID=A0AA39UKV4_9AGAR|nr:hypothetical protein EDD18DRAFT_521417 [Armillaria luteobubalina]
MIDFMTIHWDQRRRSGTACVALTNLLAKRIPVAFPPFLENQCLQFLGSHPFLEESVPLVSAYVTGILEMRHTSDRIVDTTTLQPHIDYLQNSHNLFTACSILAMHSISNIDRAAVHRDITTLIQLCPRNTAWGECRRKLCDLVQGDGGEFFSKQRVQDFFPKLRPLRTEEIQVEKDNIKYAIQVLDDFLDGRAHTSVGRFYHFLGWCVRRKPDDKAAHVHLV